MAAKWIEAITGSLEEKKLYKQAQARINALPEPCLLYTSPSPRD